MKLVGDQDIERIEELFHRAADLPAAERRALLDEQCGDAPAVRERVEGMLARLESDESLRVPAIDPSGITEGPGSTIGRYKLLQQIGEGGYGVVYMAEQTEPVRRKVALKVIKLGMDTREVVLRFEAERQALALMDHPAIAKVLDGGATETGRPYFVMELVRGVSITEYCDQDELGTRERLELFREVCSAVHHAHQKGVIHRDLKPSNVMVTLHDGRAVPKVIDFGIAKAIHTRLTEKTLFTEYQRFIGTPAYMSPEQAEMSALDVDTRTDIYSLGVLLYELLTGSTPFDPTDLFEAGLAEVQRVIREEEPERPSMRISTTADAAIARRRGEGTNELARHVRGDLDWIVMKSLEKDRTRRYGSASELADDVLRHLEHDPVLAGPPSASYRMGKFLVKNRGVVTSVLVILLALVGGIVGTSVGMVEAAGQRDEARREADRAKSVTDFLVDTLALGDPEIARAPSLTIQEVLQRASTRVGVELGGEPRAEARVRIAIGRAYESLGEPELAEAHLRRAIDLASELDDYDQAELYHALWRLTHVLFVLEEPDALTTAQHARRVAHDHIRASQPLLADALESFVDTVDEAAHTQEADVIERAVPLFHESVRISEELLPRGDELWPIVADSYQHAGYDLWFSPHEPASIPYWERTLEIQRRELPAGHPILAQTLAQLTGVLNRTGRLAEAERHIRESLSLVTNAYPARSFKVALARAGLGENLSMQGRHAEAEELLLESHADILGTTDAVTFYPADSYSRVISLYARWGREDDASRYRAEFAELAARSSFLQPFSIGSQCFGPEHAELLAKLTRVREICGNLTYPVALGERSDPELFAIVDGLVELRRATLDDDHPLAIEAGRYLLHWANQVDPAAEARTRELMLEEALRVVPAIEESAPLEVAEACAQSSEVARLSGDAARARELARRAVSALAGAPERDAWFGAAAKMRIARCIYPLGLFAEAEALVLPGYEVFLDQLGAEHSKTATVRQLVLDLYTAWGKPEEARRFRSPGPAPR